ncbi:MAG: bifunctional diaminohydroxyphosphoribosylaminopyrimidine deaminase/5-amino-6-(5-phosphoribosylamino)uracil reductase RibD [Proteocatella sp.]
MDTERFMKLAIELAAKGGNRVSPNPLVGAVIVKNAEIIGQGYHEAYGGPHAEINALSSCKESPKGACIYVTLEPCCHYGKTPPCTEAIIKSGISKVVIGSKDPNPLVAGKGIESLRRAGVGVEILDMEACYRLNEIFFHYIKTKRPYVIMKYAMTADGKIATFSGKSKWITGEVARAHVHESRNRYAGIMVGVGTVIADNPELTCRIPGGRNPKRIICDTNLRIPLDSKVLNTKEAPTYIATCSDDEQKISALESLGCRILRIPKNADRLDLKFLMKRLAEEKIDAILLEGGATLNASALEAKIVSRVQVYISPKIFGGNLAKSPVGGQGVENPSEAFMLKNGKIRVMDEDILIEYEVDECLQE